jgi:hypothetical protein
VRELGEHPDETERRCRAELARGYAQPIGGERRQRAA